MHTTVPAPYAAPCVDGVAASACSPGHIINHVIRPLLDRMAGGPTADNILVESGTRFEIDSRWLFDRLTGQTGHDKIHVWIDFEALPQLVLDCGFSLAWMTTWECSYRFWARHDGALILIPLDPQVRRHVTIEDGHLMIADWSAYTTPAERAAGFSRADAVLAGLMGN
ncbi:hypothetical protein [Novosphingobium sp. KA1]|uniref:hypothetical protein n=1 Tax=Novosphingobium sp. (strain KA1) TaxID=164608 RepID=UPI001A8EEE6F|nr:hypothetical protein [Novosphingobium sp. KA1]QSR17437.1 hypothetical protein CA833_09620 [Novosphingobium sp. KA1]